MSDKARAQQSQGVANRPCVGAILKTVSSTCPAEAVQVGNLAARPSFMVGQPDKWASRAQSSARAPPYSSYKYHGAPPRYKV
jgi:hypothetical protein